MGFAVELGCGPRTAFKRIAATAAPFVEQNNLQTADSRHPKKEPLARMIFTFYSYKGGVGRSMALAGIAHLLARRGLKVLAMDFDLEAPGLERYFFDGEHARSVRGHPGLVDLIQAYRRALTSQAAFDQAEFKQWERFRLTAISVAGSLGGSVDLITAGQREPEDKLQDYALTVRTFDWQDFFHNWKGDLFFDWLRRKLRDPSAGYDVVLVDSRTGVTEMGGVCAYQLADVAVLLCAPNYQNLEGTRDVARDFRSGAVLALRHGRPLEILTVPARLEPNHPRRAEFLSAFERELGVDGLPAVLAEAGLSYEKLALPYLKDFAVVERLVGDAGGSVPSEAMVAVFGRLADALTLLAEPGTKLHAQRADALARLRGDVVLEARGLEADPTRTSAGYDIFLDYGAKDATIVGRIRATLEQSALRVYDNGTAGTTDDAADLALDYSAALVLIFGSDGTTPARERLLARARRNDRVKIVPVVLWGGADGALESFGLERGKALDFRLDRETPDYLDIARHLGHRQAAAAPAQSTGPTTRDPYPGAAPYREDDAASFCGREAEVSQLRELVARHGLVLVSGPAKVGKTSLLLAGLLPSLRPGTAGTSDIPLRELAILDCGSDGEPDFREWCPSPREDGSGAAAPDLILVDGLDSFPGDASAERRDRRLDGLCRLLAREGARCKFVLAWRDALPEDARRAFRDALAPHAPGEFELKPLAGECLRRAVEEPARRVGHLLEPGLAERLIESAGPTPGALFRIQLALAAIWPERRRGWLTNQSLDAAGHLGGIFEKHLLAVLAGLSETERHGAEVLFKSLCTLDASLRLLPEPRPWDTLAAVPALQRAGGAALRDRLAEAGLVDLWRDRRPAAEGEPAPDRLCVGLVRRNPAAYFGGGEQVPDARFLLWRGQFASYVYHWTAAGRPDDALLSGSALDEARQWLGARADELGAEERDLIDASLAARERAEREAEERQRAEYERDAAARAETERREAAEALAEAERRRADAEAEAKRQAEAAAAAEAERRAIAERVAAAERQRADAESQTKFLAESSAASERERRLLAERVAEEERQQAEILRRHRKQLFAALLALVLLMLFGLWQGWKAVQSEEKARQEAARATALLLAAKAQDNLASGQATSAEYAFLQLATAGRLAGRDNAVLASVVTAYGVWAAERYSRKMGATVLTVAYSPDGNSIAAGGRDMTVRQWVAFSGFALEPTLSGHGGNVNAVTYSPNGRWLASASDDGTARLWDTETGQPGPVLRGHQGTVESVAFSPDGRQLVSGGGDGTLRFWNTVTGQPFGFAVTGHNGAVWSVAVSPNGRLVASGGQDQTIRQWDTATGQPAGKPIIDPSGPVHSVAYSPDGRRILSGGTGSAGIWDTATGRSLGPPMRAPVDWHPLTAAYSPDGSIVVTGDRIGGSIQFWDANTGQALGPPLEKDFNAGYGVAFSPDGRRIVSGSSDGGLIIRSAPRALADEICKKLTRNPSRKEWTEWVSPEIPYREACPGLPIPPDEPDRATGR
jgi:WD40 repeat protein